MFVPKYSINDQMALFLMEIQKASTLVEQLPLPLAILQELQQESATQRVVLSRKIEDTHLDERQMREAIYQDHASGEEQAAVHLWKAMQYLDECMVRNLPITDELIKNLHAIIDGISSGRKPIKSEYRREKTIVLNVKTAEIIYIPPEWQDVPNLMEDLVTWVNSAESYQLPPPIKAGIFLWQFLTIHPYLNGNDPTGRALTTYLLRQSGLEVKDLFILESYYHRNLDGYVQNLQMELPHNYYFGRNSTDLTQWLCFFLQGLSEVFQEAAELVKSESERYFAKEPDLLRALDPHQRLVFAHLALKRAVLPLTELYRLLHISDRTGRERIKRWISNGFVQPTDQQAKRIRSIRLTSEYEELAETIRKDIEAYRYLFS